MINNDPKLTEIVEKIVSAVHPLKIYLFGSRARGDDAPESDLDLLIVQNETVSRSTLREMRAQVRKALWDLTVPLDILVYSDKEFNEWKSYPNHVIGRVAKEGKVIYEAA